MRALPHLVLVDGSGFIFRAYHALPPMSSPDGRPVNAVYGFTNMLARLLRDDPKSALAVIFDAGRATFRHEIYAKYKANRPELPQDLIAQFSLVRDAVRAFNVMAVESAGWEADDLIATYATAIAKRGGRCTIVSSDKDLMQLITPQIEMFDPIKQRRIGQEDVEKKFGVPPEQVVDVQALMGDSSDNVPGIPGIGPKNAAQLIQEYGSLESVLAAAPTMKKSRRQEALVAHAQDARISYRLVTLARDVPPPAELDAFERREVDRAVLTKWLTSMGFKSLIHRAVANGDVERTASQVNLRDAPQDTAAPPPFTGYQTVTTLEALDEWIAKARQMGKFALDTETDSLNARRARLVGLSLCVAPGAACYIPIAHVGTLESPVSQQLDAQRVCERLAPLLTDESILKIFQNAKYDLLVLAGLGLERIAPIDDTMVMSCAQASGEHGHGMDELAFRYLGHSPISYDSVTGTGRKRMSFAEVSIDRATEYAAEDADVTFRLWEILRRNLRERQALALYEEMERPLIPILTAMEQRGIKVDIFELRRLSEDFSRRMAAMQAEIYTLAGRSFNLGSPKQLGEILFDEMGLSGARRTKTGAWGTDSSVLQSLADQGHALPERLLEWRQLAKLKSTYADALVGQADAGSGRIHTSYNMAATTTGRLASNDPNLQNIPIRTDDGGRIRRAFIAEKEKVLVSADYSQIELRLLASVADVVPLIDAFEKNLDIHALTASEVFDIPIERLDAQTRRRAKAINFGIVYGISPYGLARQLSISPAEAKKYIDTYFARYPGIAAYMARTKAQAVEKGYVVTPFGRRCYVPGIIDKDANKRGYAERQAINAPLQGGAADIIKLAMVRIARLLEETPRNGELLLQVHDELVFEVAAEEAESFAALIKIEMERAAKIKVPLVVQTGIGVNWAQAH